MILRILGTPWVAAQHRCGAFRPPHFRSMSADMLLFEQDERGPDEELKLQFEAVSRLDPEEKKIIRSVIESMILRHEARRWSPTTASARK